MPPGSLIPDRQLTFSPDLAATIGLEEAILLQGLGNVSADKEVLAQRILLSDLQRMFPFWQPTEIQQLLLRCLLYTSPSPRDRQKSRMPSSA